MHTFKCKEGQLLAKIDGAYWLLTPNHGKLFCGCDHEKAVAEWRWYVNNAMKAERSRT